MAGEGFIIDANNRMKQNRSLAKRVKDRNFQQKKDQHIKRGITSSHPTLDPKEREKIRKTTRRKQRNETLVATSITIIITMIIIGVLIYLF